MISKNYTFNSIKVSNICTTNSLFHGLKHTKRAIPMTSYEEGFNNPFLARNFSEIRRKIY